MNWPPPEYLKVVERKVVEYLRTDGRLSLPKGDGPIQALETAYAKWVRVPYALAVNSGTSAIHSAYVAIGLEPGDEVLAPAYTFHSSVTPLLHVGAKPVLCEVDVITGNLNPDDAASRVTKRTRAIIVTHMYGYPADMEGIIRLARRYDLKIIEDCSQAHGATFKGQPVGSLGDVGVFSLQEGKLAPAGEGGILVTSSLEIYERAVALGHFGERAFTLTNHTLRKIAETGFGFKYRMHPLAALAGLAGLDIAQRYIQQRCVHAKAIAEGLAQTKAVSMFYNPEATYFLFRLRYHPEAFDNIPIDDFVSLARERGLNIRRASLRSLPELPIFQGGAMALNRYIGNQWPRYSPRDFPLTFKYADCLLGMPVYWHPSHCQERNEFIEKLINITPEDFQ